MQAKVSTEMQDQIKKVVMQHKNELVNIKGKFEKQWRTCCGKLVWFVVVVAAASAEVVVVAV